MRRLKPRIKKKPPLFRQCPVCEKKIDLDYRKPEVLAQFLSDWGKILGREKTGVCAQHQRRLAREIKRARFLALLPFVARVR